MRATTKFLNASLALSSVLFAVNNSLSVQPAMVPLPTLNAAQEAPSKSDSNLAIAPASNSATSGTNADPKAGTAAKPQPGETAASTGATPQATAQPADPKTLISDRIPYKYGEIQLQLTKTGAQITDISVLAGDMSYGRDVAYQTLIAATISTQGTNYGNVSGATFTTDAFKQAVQNALAKG